MSLARIRQVPKPSKPDYRIALRPDDWGLDDVVVKDVSMFRMERMDIDNFWLCCYFPDDERERITFGLHIKDGMLHAYVSEMPRGPAFPYEPGSMTGYES